MQWFDGIDDALTKPERELLTRLKLKIRAGESVSPYPGYDQYSKLCARYERKANLRRFQQQVEAFTFAEIIVGEQLEHKGETLIGYTAGQPRQWLERFNLPAKKRAYDQLSANMREAGLLDYSQDARLFLQQQDAEEAATIQQYADGLNIPDRPKAARQMAITRRLFSELRQYVEEDLKRLATPADMEAKSNKLSLKQLALVYTYENKVIPKVADEIARKYGHQSGAKLYEHYLTVSQRAGRIGNEITGQKLVPMIKDITAVIPHLAGAARQQAESERQTLEARKDEK